MISEPPINFYAKSFSDLTISIVKKIREDEEAAYCMFSL